MNWSVQIVTVISGILKALVFFADAGRVKRLDFNGAELLVEIYVSKELLEGLSWQEFVTMAHASFKFLESLRVLLHLFEPTLLAVLSTFRPNCRVENSSIWWRWPCCSLDFLILYLVSWDEEFEDVSLLRFKLFQEGVRLLHSIAVDLVLNNLFLNDLLTEFELVDAVDEVLLGNVVALASHAFAHHRFHALTPILNDFF